MKKYPKPIPTYKLELLTGVESETTLKLLLNDRSQWDNPEYQTMGYHLETNSCGRKQYWIAWDNTTSNCWVEEFKEESQAMAWLKDEEY